MTKTYKLKIFRTFFMLFALLSCSSLWAQTITLKGTVTDKAKQAIAGAEIAVADGETGGITDDAGAFSIPFEKNSRTSIKILVVFPGYDNYEENITLGAETEITKKIVMGNASTKEVVITASKGGAQQESKDVTVSIQVVKQESIDLQATPNIDKVIVQTPGVDNLDGQLSIRGSSGFSYGAGSRVMVLLDGLPLISGDAGSAELSMIPVDNIAQVEVLKGASSVLYGSSALGGVVNIITGDPSDKPRTSIRIRQGFFDRPSNKDLDWDGSSSAYYASAHLFHQRKVGDFSFTAQTDLIKESGYRSGTDKEEIRAILHTRYQPKKLNDRLQVGLNVSFRQDSSGAIVFWDKYFPTPTQVVSGTDTSYINEGGALTPGKQAGVFRKQLNTRLAIDPYIKYLTNKGDMFWYRSRFLRNINTTNTGQSAQSYVVYNDFLYQTMLLKKISWVTGATVTYAQTNSPELYNGSYGQLFSGVYTQLDGKFLKSKNYENGRLNLSAGIRLESVKTNIYDITNEDTVSLEIKNIYAQNKPLIEKRTTRPVGRVGANFAIAQGTNLRASIGQAFRVPSIAEYFASVGAGGVTVVPNLNQPDPKRIVNPEYGYSVELALRQGYAFGSSITRKFQGYVDVAGFQMNYNDMMEFGINKLDISDISNPVAYFSTRNVSNAQITGVEITTMNSYDDKQRDFHVVVSGGWTYLNPINKNAVPESQQLNISYFNIAGNSAANFFRALAALDSVDKGLLFDSPKYLKYRNKNLIRATCNIGYKKVGLTTNYRYRSYMESLDQYLYLVVGDMGYFREKHSKGEHVFDFIASYNMTEKSMISMVVDNAFNIEYFLIPGTLAQQRSFTLQYQVKF